MMNITAGLAPGATEHITCMRACVSIECFLVKVDGLLAEMLPVTYERTENGETKIESVTLEVVEEIFGNVKNAPE